MPAVESLTSPCCQGVHIIGKAFGLDSGFHNYIGVSLLGLRLALAAVTLEKGTLNCLNRSLYVRVSLAQRSVTYFGYEIQLFGSQQWEVTLLFFGIQTFSFSLAKLFIASCDRILSKVYT